MSLKNNTVGNCPHCERENVPIKARGICRKCYAFPEIRCLYDCLPHYVKPIQGPGSDTIVKRPLPEPTDALPGTEEKVKVLKERAMLGQQLWHPLDAQWENLEQMAERMPGNIRLVIMSQRLECEKVEKARQRATEEEWESLVGDEYEEEEDNEDTNS